MITVPKIVLADRADAAAIAEMSWKYIEQGLDWSWTPARVRRAILDASTNVAVVRGRECLSGFGIMEYGEEQAHLALLAVDPRRRRRGLGSLLLSWLEKCADTAGIGRIQVEARSDNPAALAFYKRREYREVDRIPGYYSGVLAAIRLEKRFW